MKFHYSVFKVGRGGASVPSRLDSGTDGSGNGSTREVILVLTLLLMLKSSSMKWHVKSDIVLRDIVLLHMMSKDQL